MNHSFDEIDHQLRTPGRIFKLLVHPSKTGLRFLHWQMRRSIGNDMPGADSSEVWVERSDGNGTIRVRTFRPQQMNNPLPIVLFLHGGGYAIGVPEQDSYLRTLKGLMDERGCVVVAPDYRLSFDAPYPAGLYDCYDTLLWAKENAAEIGGRADQIFVIGDSAGGGLTVAVCLLARDSGDVQIAFQMPLYPMIDDRQMTPSAINNNMPVWNSKLNKIGWQLYLRTLNERSDEIPAYAAPARATSYANLPPAASFVGSLDPFLDETTAYVESLRTAGIPVQFAIFPGCYHGFDQVVPNAEITKAAIRFMTDAYAYAVDNYFAKQSVSSQ